MNHLSKLFIFFTLLALGICSNAQTNSTPYLSETRLAILSEDANGKPFVAQTDLAYMVLNLSNGDFLLNGDLSIIKTGDPVFDSLISAKGLQPFFFKGNVNENLFMFNQHVNDEKSYNMPGLLSINNNTISCIAQYDPVNFGEKNETKHYRMDFKLSVDASKITILGLENKVNKQIVFQIMDGKLNIQQ